MHWLALVRVHPLNPKKSDVGKEVGNNETEASRLDLSTDPDSFRLLMFRL